MSAKPVEQLTFEESLQELETIVSSLESGKAPLDESITAYERGIALKTHCEKKLREAQSKIEKIALDADGNVKTEPINLDN